MNKSLLIKIAGIVVLIAAAFGGIYFVRTYLPAYQAEKEYKRLLAEYQNDPYGGETPEETLALFIDALKKGDVELAAKYFVLEDREKWQADLSLAKEKNLLDAMVDEGQRLRISKQDEEKAYYTLANKEGVVEVQVILIKIQNGKWKLQDL